MVKRCKSQKAISRECSWKSKIYTTSCNRDETKETTRVPSLTKLPGTDSMPPVSKKGTENVCKVLMECIWQ